MILEEMYSKKIAGSGLLNFVLIHNAGGNHQFFTHQVKMLCHHGDVVWLDLPGHGNSAEEPNNSIDSSSEIIYEICQHYSLDNIVLIGLNNGANIAINTTYKYDLPIKRFVLIDPPILMGETFVAEIINFINEIDGEHYEVFIQSLVDNAFIQTDQANRDTAFRAFMQASKPTLRQLFQSLIKWDNHATTILSAVKVPTLCLLTDEHHCAYAKIKQVAPQFTLGKMIGSKCWATLEVPEQVNAMIERFLVLPI